MPDSPAADLRDSVFPPTRPPPITDVDLSRVSQLASIGVLSVRAALFDPATGALRGSWRINKYGEIGEYSSADWKDHFAIRSLAQVSRETASAPLTQSSNPWRREFAWRVDDRLVALARARYESPQAGSAPADMNTLQQICEGGLQLEARDERAQVATPATAALRQGAPTEAEAPTPGRVATGGKSPLVVRPTSVPAGFRPTLWLLLLLSVASTVMPFFGIHETTALQVDMLRQQARAELAMSKRIDEKMGQGDFGEVQAELDAFQELGYFDRAVVTNSQGRAIAITGQVRSVRIGLAMPPDALAGSRVVALGPVRQRGHGQLIIWPVTHNGGPTLDGQHLILLASGLLSGAAAVAAAAMLLLDRRGRHRGRRNDV